MSYPIKFGSRKEMEANDELWEQHPLLVSYEDFHDATTGAVVAKVATFHRRVEQWDDVCQSWVMVDLFSNNNSPQIRKTKSP